MSHRAEIDRLLRSWPSDWKRQWTNARAQLKALEYDAPAHPDASDALMALYLTAGGRESGDPVKGSIPVPAAVREEAMRAVRMAHRFNYGAWNFIGLARAIQLATVPRIDTRSVERMRGFFTRHAKDARAPGFGNDERPSRGYLAHLVWGGDPAKEWVMGMEKRAKRNESALSPEIPDRAPRTAAFKRWFGSSKVVDRRGKPLLVFHGSNRPFSAFDYSRWGKTDPGFAGKGFYFSDHMGYARAYAEMDAQPSDAPTVLAVYLRMENPLVVREYGEIPGSTGRVPTREQAEDMTRRVRAMGYDGVIVAGKPGNPSEYVVFEPTQIKSATGNRGTFDPADPDIRHNPSRVRRNPLAQPSPTMAFSFRKDAIPGVVEVYLYEPDDIDDTERSMVAGMMASFNGKRWEASGVAACPGYGPLIYDLTATLLKERLYATRDRSEASKRFWARQGKKYIEPMTPEDFRAKYGMSVDDIYRRGLVLTPEDLRRMSDHLVSVFFGAKEAEKAGKRLALARCAVPNGRGRG